MRIILVEDEIAIREIQSTILIDEGHELFEAGTDEEALALLEIPDVQLAIVDYMIPGVKWIAATYISKLKDTYPDIKILMCSARERRELEEFTEIMNIEGFIHKPFSIEQFINTVKEQS